MEWFREGGVLLGALREHGGVEGHGVRHPHSSLTRIRLNQPDRRYHYHQSAPGTSDQHVRRNSSGLSSFFSSEEERCPGQVNVGVVD
jgi:hypothetical protein